MSRQGKAFTAAFLNQMTQGIKDRGTIGLGLKKRRWTDLILTRQIFKKDC